MLLFVRRRSLRPEGQDRRGNAQALHHRGHAHHRGQGPRSYRAAQYAARMMASNNDWVVPAGEHERRFVVQKVSNVHRQDPAWFGPLYKKMREAGYEAMLFDLLARDLGDWHPRDIVRTTALVDQQMKSLSPLRE